MDYSTSTFEFSCDTEGLIFDLDSLYAHFESLTDSRKRRGLRHPLPVILVAMTLGKMAGEDKPKGIAEWARLRADLFIHAFDLKRKEMPHHNTYRRILQDVIELSEFAKAVEKILSALPEVGTSVHLTLDGKTVRGTIASGKTKGLHLLAVYIPGSGITLRQVAVDGKTNEIPVGVEVLNSLDLQGKIVTGDALHTQRQTSQQIVEAGGEYLWVVKENQERLKRDIELLFQPEVCAPGFSPAPKDFRQVQTINKGHGRIEKRTLTLSSLLAEETDWPFLAQVFKLEREVTTLQSTPLRFEVVYGVTSLTSKEANPAQVLELQRRQWAIESELHYRRDVTLGEDACRCKHYGMAQAMAILNNLVLALLLRGRQRNAAHAQRYYNAHPDRALALISRSPNRL